MRRALLLAHYLLRAIFYTGVILLALPLRAVFGALPHNERGQRQMTDTAATVEEVLSSYPPSREGYTQDAVEGDLVDLREWAETAKTMLTELSVDVSNARHALHGADVPGANGEGQAHRLGDQVLWLVGNRDWHREEVASLKKRLAEVEATAHTYYERNVALSRSFEDDRRALTAELDQQRAGFMKQRDDALKDAAFFKEQAEVATAELRTEQALTRTLKALVVDADAQLEALQVETSMLEAHIDCIDEALSEYPDMWADWDLEPGDGPEEEP